MSAAPPAPGTAPGAARLTPLYVLCCLPGSLVLLYWAFCYVGRSWSVLTFPFGYDYGEAPELNRALAVAHLQPFYPFWTYPPYQMANYTPLFSVLNGIFVRLAGAQFQSGRAIAWVCGLLFCAGLAWLAWREGETWLAPVVTSLLWFCSNYVWNWTPLGREDELAMLFSVAGLIAFYEGGVRAPQVALARPATRARRHGRAGKAPLLRGTRYLWLAGVLYLAAIYTRQTTIEAAAAAGIYLLIRRPRLGVAVVLLFGLTAGLIFVLLDAATRGAFFLNVITGNRNLYHWQRVITVGHQFWTYYQGAAILAGFYALTQLVSRRHQLFVLWLLLTFAVAATVGKEGAADNYLLLPWGAVSLTAGLAVSRAACWSSRLWKGRLPVLLLSRPVALLLPLLIGFLLLLQAQLTFHLPYQGQFDRSTVDFAGRQGVNGLIRRWTESGWYRRLLPGEPTPAALEGNYGYLYKPSLGAFDRLEQQQIVAMIAAAPGDVYDEDMTHVLSAGKRIYIQPFEFAQEALLGPWDQRPFLASIDRGRFSLVITTKQLRANLKFERYTPQMAAALTANYCLDTQTSNYFVYRPCNGGG
jgi:hypothetical protein